MSDPNEPSNDPADLRGPGRPGRRRSPPAARRTRPGRQHPRGTADPGRGNGAGRLRRVRRPGRGGQTRGRRGRRHVGRRGLRPPSARARRGTLPRSVGRPRRRGPGVPCQVPRHARDLAARRPGCRGLAPPTRKSQGTCPWLPMRTRRGAAGGSAAHWPGRSSPTVSSRTSGRVALRTLKETSWYTSSLAVAIIVRYPVGAAKRDRAVMAIEGLPERAMHPGSCHGGASSS